jgi:hypothetical protein
VRSIGDISSHLEQPARDAQRDFISYQQTIRSGTVFKFLNFKSLNCTVQRSLSRQGQNIGRNFAATKVTCGAATVFQVICGHSARDAQRDFISYQQTIRSGTVFKSLNFKSLNCVACLVRDIFSFCQFALTQRR